MPRRSISPQANELLQKALAGNRLSADEGIQLFQNADLLFLGKVADERRKKAHPERVVTFIVDRNINYTNVCVSGCKFCAFYRELGHPEAYLLSFSDLAQKVEETLELGGTRILMQGGMHPELTINYYEEMLCSIKSKYAIEIDAFSPPEIDHISRLSHLTTEETLRRLRAAGLDGLPGGGAEILDDAVRRRVSPNKIGWQRWLEVMAVAQKQELVTSATMVFGLGETLKQRFAHLDRLRTAQDAAGAGFQPDNVTTGFSAFIPWSFQPKNTALGGDTVTGDEYLRTLAVSRLLLDNFPNVQASWVTQGAKLAQVAVRFGANDFGNVMIEENVVRAAGVTYRISLQEIVALIKDAGFQPAQRDSRYRILRYF
ncbi:MAG: dehypoxanthine futalosine cyclase [Chloroflexi bacterium]|nr:dehypoxanthine futalosine cyclase [Chloroflexota bacterium]